MNASLIYLDGNARCALCGHVLLRLVNVRQRVLLDLSGMKHLTF